MDANTRQQIINDKQRENGGQKTRAPPLPHKRKFLTTASYIKQLNKNMNLLNWRLKDGMMKQENGWRGNKRRTKTTSL